MQPGHRRMLVGELIGSRGETVMIHRGPIVQVNSSSIPVAGLGGIGLLAVAAVMAVVFPEAQFMMLAGSAGGLLLALFWIAVRRGGSHSRPSGDSPAVLFRADPQKRTHSGYLRMSEFEIS